MYRKERPHEFKFEHSLSCHLATNWTSDVGPHIKVTQV